ncbi:MAG: POTRA domain-containing protein, partial [Nitrospinaceae bacterium]|nr:POTRA domain-containing protein [Nitrospinaceae bacterium]
MPKVKWRPLPILVVVLLWAFAVSSYAQGVDIVGSVEVRGNKRVVDSTILYYIKTKKGEPLSRSQVRKDIEQIYNLGQF